MIICPGRIVGFFHSETMEEAVMDMTGKKKTARHAELVKQVKKNIPFYLFLAPALILVIIFCYFPMWGIVIAFKDYKMARGILGSEWVGLFHFKKIFSDPNFYRVLGNTIKISVLTLVTSFPVTIVFALLVNEIMNMKFKRVVQTITYMPHFLSWVVVTALIWAFLSFDKGLLNSLLEFFGKDPHQWYMEPKLWPPFLIFMYMWKNLGYSMVVYLATITGIDKTYYEAAGIDGATVWQQMRYVTLPLMKTVIIMMFIMAVGRIFYSDFGLFYQVPRDSNSLYNVSYTLDVFVFKQLKSSTTGMASAAAFVQSVAGCITILTANAVVRKVDRDSAMI